MKVLFIVIFSLNLLFSFGNQVILCKDLKNLNKKIKLVLHKKAQERAQKDAEKFMNKKIIRPFPNLLGQETNISITSRIIEIFWCVPNMPLHEAWYNFYMRNKIVWEK
jgi:hypothetical protein